MDPAAQDIRFEVNPPCIGAEHAVVVILEETKTHVSRIDQAFESLGAKPKAVLCKGMQGLLAEGADHIEQDAGDVFGDLTLLEAGQRVEHYWGHHTKRQKSYAKDPSEEQSCADPPSSIPSQRLRTVSSGIRVKDERNKSSSRSNRWLRV